MSHEVVMGQKYNVISFGKRFENLSISVRIGTIGSNLTTFQNHVEKGAVVFLHCKGEIWGCGTVISDCEKSSDRLWPNDTYPFRSKISVEHLTLDPVSLSNGVYNTALRAEFGVGWAYKFLFSPRPLPEKIGQKIYDDLRNRRSENQDAFLVGLEKNVK